MINKNNYSLEFSYFNAPRVNITCESNTKVNVEFFEGNGDLIYKSVLTDTIQNDDSSLDREADLRLFFLAPSNFQDWKTDDHYTGAILPMRSLAYNFIDILNKSTKIARFDSYTLTNRVNFGVYVTDRGNTERIFNDNMSGVEMRITLPIKKDLTCNGC